MRRAIIAVAGTVVGLVALLGYKSSGSVGHSTVAVGANAAGGTSLTTPATGSTATTAPGGGAGATTPATSGPTPAGTPAPPTTAPASSTPAQYTGVDVPYQYGDIQLRITVAGHRITAIDVPQESATDPRSQSINSQAVPILTQEALAAQNLHFDVVSGATFTSDAFAQALQSALTKAGR